MDKSEKDKISVLPTGDQRYRFNSTKLPWHMERVRKRFDKGERVAPIHMDVGITKACNIECVFCLGFYQNMTGEIMPYDATVNLLRDAPQLGVKSMGIIGDGEPTLNPALYEAIKSGKKGGLDIGIATNGVALNESKIETLVKNCVWIRFNLGAVERGAYKRVHGRDFWPRVKENIEKTISTNEKAERPCTIGLQMVTTPLSQDQIIPEAKWAVDIGADYFEIKQMTQVDDARMISFPLDWYKKQDVIDALKEAESLSTERTIIMPKWTMMQSGGKRNYNHCLDVSLLMQVSGNGECYPCAYLFNHPEYLYGDLKKQSLGEILEGDRYWRIIEQMEKNFDVHQDCEGCCRHDRNNEFLYYYVHEKERFKEFWRLNVQGKPTPRHLNFI